MGRNLRRKQFYDLAKECCIPSIDGLGKEEVVRQMEEAHGRLRRGLRSTRRGLVTVLAAASFVLKMNSQDWGEEIEYYIHRLPLYPRQSSLQTLRHQELFLAWGKFPTKIIDDEEEEEEEGS